MANVPVTGLSALGSVIADAGQTYARNARQDQLIAQQRAMQLEDVRAADQREQSRYTRGREDQLSDVDSARKRDDDVYGRRRGDQLSDVEDARLYSESMHYLENARKLKERAPFETNLQRVVDDAATQLTEVQRREQEVGRIVMAPAPEAGPNDPQVLALAQTLAGGSRKKEDIQAMMPKALEQINGMAMMKHASAVRSANEVLQNLRAARQQLTDLIQSGIQKNVAPAVSPPSFAPPGSMLPQSQTPKSANAADIAGAVGKLLGGNDAPPASRAPSGPTLLSDPTNEPLIQAENQRRAQAHQVAARKAIEDPYNEALQRLASIRNNIAGVRQGNPQALAAVENPMGGWIPGQPVNPSKQASALSQLLQQEAALDKQARDLEAQLQGPVVAAATPPALSTPMGSTPAVPFATPAMQWWQSQKPLGGR